MANRSTVCGSCICRAAPPGSALTCCGSGNSCSRVTAIPAATPRSARRHPVEHIPGQEVLLSSEETGPASRATWSVDRIPYDRLDRSAVTEDMAFFYTVTSASLVEFASAVYADSLAELFADDDEVAGWLAGAWRSEELQHGEALKRY